MPEPALSVMNEALPEHCCSGRVSSYRGFLFRPGETRGYSAFSRKETLTYPSALSVRTCTQEGSSQVSSTISR